MDVSKIINEWTVKNWERLPDNLRPGLFKVVGYAKGTPEQPRLISAGLPKAEAELIASLWGFHLEIERLKAKEQVALEAAKELRHIATHLSDGDYAECGLTEVQAWDKLEQACNTIDALS